MTPDPTAHAEVQAIRMAARGLGTHELTGCVLYSSCEPCPMCLAAAMWAGVARVEYAATAEDAARAGFDDSRFYAEVREGVTSFGYHHTPTPDRLGPFDAWRAQADRVTY